jgi:hypothetical protein
VDQDWLKQQARRAYRAVETGDVSDLDEFIAPEWRNREAEAEPPAAKGFGPAAFAATVAWLRGAYSEIRFVEEESIAEGNTVISRAMMSGRDAGALVLQDRDRLQVIPRPVDHSRSSTCTSRTSTTRGRAIEHHARRDDLGLMVQLGLFPPNPSTLLRSVSWTVSGRSRAARRDFLA